MGLDRYQRKRHFEKTPEPSGATATRPPAGKAATQRGTGRRAGKSAAAPAGTLQFVVQKHAARRLHYDLRLELQGVLKSWAVPKGPSLDPHEKRLAVEVEDHPLEYGGFEGTIPAGEYGAGEVIVWDRGTWVPEGDPLAGLAKGHLAFDLHGQKLRGRWALVRLKPGAGNEQPSWLLIKQVDDEARPASEYDILAAQPESVLSSKTLDETRGRSRAAVKAVDDLSPPPPLRKLRGAKRAPLPGPLTPQLAALSGKPPDGPQWLHEIKFDGYRMLCYRQGGDVHFYSRQQHDWTARVAALVPSIQQLPAREAIYDGEVVALRSDGVSDFQELQNAFSTGAGQRLIYYAFDLLYLDGFDLRSAPLEDRKTQLAWLLRQNDPAARIRYSEHFEGDATEFFRQCCRMKLEGMISKRRDRPYVSRRTEDWQKTKCVEREEFVIVGFTEPGGSREGLGALLLGYYTPAGELKFAGRAGTGFSDQVLRDLRRRLDELEQDEPHFPARTPGLPKKGAHWVRPELVAQVEFTNWTREGLLRHPSFQGLREDKPARSVTHDPESEATAADARDADDDAAAAMRAAEASSRKPAKQARKATPAMKSAAKRAGARVSSPHSAEKAAMTNTARSAARAKHNGSARARPRTPPKRRASELRLEDLDVRLTHPDRVLYPEQGVTKLDLAKFYVEIRDWILPQIVDRPLSLFRCPDGRHNACFFQKNAGRGSPETLRHMPIQEKEKTTDYLIVEDLKGLLGLVQMGVLEVHPWGARRDNIERPDRLTFDLDPDAAVPWPRVIAAAFELRDLLTSLDLQSFVKTTGGKGLHIVLPIQRRQSWDEVKEFTRLIAERMAHRAPERYTTNMSKRARGGKIFIDYLRNQRGATAVAAYSTRARPGAPVSVPVTWDELPTIPAADHFDLHNLPQRLAKLADDPWGDLPHVKQSITAERRREVAAAR